MIAQLSKRYWNKGRLHAIRVRTLLYNVDACPRRLVIDSTVLICPG